jgi:tetratricopeptide (TPR) repeat protein
MTYTDSEGKVKHWTQPELAKVLGISEVAVRLMETQNRFLDSIERRRLLAEILKIPPMLLGLGSLSELEQFLQNKPSTTATSKKPTISTETANLYHEAFQVYSQAYKTGSIIHHRDDIEQWIVRIQGSLPDSGKLEAELNRTLWLFHTLVARIYSNDLEQYSTAFPHLNEAIAIANMLNDSDLKSAAMYLTAEVHFDGKSPAMARSDLDTALHYAKTASPEIKCAVYTYAARAYALTRSDLADAVYTEKLLEQGESHADPKMSTPLLRLDYGKFLLDKADVLVNLGRYGKASEWLDEAEDYISPTQQRRHAHIHLLRAESAIKSKRRDYEQAVTLLAEALSIGKSFCSSFTINYVKRLHELLASTNFAGHPQLAELATELRTAFPQNARKHY